MNKKLRKILLFLTMLLVVTGVVMLFMPITLVAGTGYTVPVGNFDIVRNPFDCPDCGLGGSTEELTVNPGDQEAGTINGTHTDGTLTVTITGDSGENGGSFSWTSNIPVCYLIVKLGSVDNDGAPYARGYSIPAGTLSGSWGEVFFRRMLR